MLRFRGHNLLFVGSRKRSIPGFMIIVISLWGQNAVLRVGRVPGQPALSRDAVAKSLDGPFLNHRK